MKKMRHSVKSAMPYARVVLFEYHVCASLNARTRALPGNRGAYW